MRPRRTLLIGLDLIRAGVAAALPFGGEPWQVYVLMTVLYAASAAFTPAFQAMIPDILPNEKEYTKARSLSRLAADLESVASPVLAALLLTVLSFVVDPTRWVPRASASRHAPSDRHSR